MCSHTRIACPRCSSTVCRCTTGTNAGPHVRRVCAVVALCAVLGADPNYCRANFDRLFTAGTRQPHCQRSFPTARAACVCPAGKYTVFPWQDGVGAIACVDCTTGQFAEMNLTICKGCVPDTLSATGAAKCTACEEAGCLRAPPYRHAATCNTPPAIYRSRFGRDPT